MGNGIISSVQSLKGDLNNPILNVYPDLENLEIEPSTEEQNFKSSKYGYDNVKVKKIKSTELNIMPSAENQVNEGMFNKVTIAGDSNLIANNIKQGVEIFGVVGIAEIKGEENTIIDTIPLKFSNGVTLGACIKVAPTIDMVNQTFASKFAYNYSSLRKVKLINCNQITNFSEAFYGCNNIEEIELLDCTGLKNVNSMFSYNTSDKLTNVTITGNPVVTNVAQMFSYSKIPQSTIQEIVNSMDFSATTDFTYFFCGNSNITSQININLSSATRLTEFYGNTNIENVNLTDTGNVTTCNNMFRNCSKLKTAYINTDEATDIQNICLNCTELQTFSISSASKIKQVSYAFQNCTKLESISGFVNYGQGFTQKSNNYANYKLDLSKSTLLTHDSLLALINDLYDLNLTYNVAGGGTLYRQQLLLGSTNLAKLTDEEKAIATEKGWNLL